MIEIDVPEFRIRAGGAAITVEHLHDERWKARVPNNVGVTPELRFEAVGFDSARSVVEHLADVFAYAERRYQDMHEGVTSTVEAILEDARQEAQRAGEGGA